ncbi:MAG: IPT/TIG domain-containing protein, partial [Bacteroidetes bacterium]|nr:IPT/TIG domain-containing protein [Bacteroidota bacterium]
MPKKLVLLLALVAFLFQVTAAQESPIYKWASKVMGSSCYLGSNNSQLTKSDGAGNAYILGSFCQPFDADPGTAVFTLTADNSNYDDSFLIKLDPQGNFLWATRFAEAPYFNFASALTIDANGNVYTVTSYQISASDYRTVVSKFDASGNAIWSDRFHTIQSYGQAIVLDASGNPILTGGFSGTVDFDPGAGVQSVTSNGGADLFILKLDIDGNFLWVQTTGGTGGEGGRSLALDASGNIIVAGIYSGTTDLNPGAAVNSFTAAGSLDIFILKLDATGNYIWAKSIGNTNNDYSTSVAVNTSGAVFLTGYFLGSVDFDPDAGVTTLTSGVYTDIFLMRLNANGSFGWAYSFGGSDNDEGRSITTDVGGNLIFSGFFNGTVDFDPGAGVRNLVSIGQTNYQNMFIAKLNESGQLIWAQEIASTTQTSSTVRGYTISTDTTGDILLGGTAGGTTDFDFGICNRTLGNNPPVGFVMKIKTGSAPGPPVITSFSPTSGVTGDTVVITGTNFSSDPSENIVRWNPSRTAVVIASTDTTITARIPTGASTGKISVTVSCYPIALSSTNFTVGAALLPTITSFTPSSGLVGTTVTITGTNFSTTTTSNTVTFNGTAAVVTASTTTSITTSVPSGATTGKIAVTVGGNTA